MGTFIDTLFSTNLCISAATIVELFWSSKSLTYFIHIFFVSYTFSYFNNFLLKFLSSINEIIFMYRINMKNGIHRIKIIDGIGLLIKMFDRPARPHLGLSRLFCEKISLIFFVTHKLLYNDIYARPRAK